jgi:hypothetical protein
MRLADFRFARAERPRRLGAALETDNFAARHVASTVLLQLELLGKDVARLSEDPEFIRLLRHNDLPALQRFIEQPRWTESTSRPFASWYVLNPQGNILALAPLNREIVGRNFRGRDYFRGAIRHTGGPGRAAPYISHVFLAQNDHLYKFGIAVPVHQRNQGEAPLLGVLVATVTTDVTMGKAELDDPRRKAVLIGPLDTNTPSGESAEGRDKEAFVVLLHPAYHRGEDAVPFPAEKLPVWREDDVQLSGNDNYSDPVAVRHAEYAGRWLAGFAPVGNTGFTVVVQERYNDVIEPMVVSIWELGLWVIAAGAVLAIFLGGGVWIVVRRFTASPVPVPADRGV